MKLPSAHERARRLVEELAGAVDGWHADAAAQDAEQQSLQAELDGAILAGDDDDPAGITAAVTRWRARAVESAARMAELQAGAALSRRVAGEAQGRLDVARRAVLRHEAAALRRRADVAERAAESHAARSAELLGLLAEHEGVDFAPSASLGDSSGVVTRAGGSAGGWAPPTRSQRMAADAAHLRVQADLVDLVADGQPLPSFYPGEMRPLSPADLPACLHGPEAVVELYPGLVGEESTSLLGV